MPFPESERSLLHTVQGVGPKVVARLEQIGFSSLAELADADASEVARAIAAELGASCWRNSPMARAALQGAIELARGEQAKTAARRAPLPSP